MKSPTLLRGRRTDHMRVPIPLFPVIVLAATVPVVLAADLAYRAAAERVYLEIASGVTQDVASMTAARLARWPAFLEVPGEVRLGELGAAAFGERGEVIVVDLRSGRLLVGPAGPGSRVQRLADWPALEAALARWERGTTDPLRFRDGRGAWTGSVARDPKCPAPIGCTMSNVSIQAAFANRVSGAGGRYPSAL